MAGEQYDEEAITAALQRITLRQQQRQYAAATTTTTNLIESEAAIVTKPPAPPSRLTSASSVRVSARGANETFNSFVADAYGAGQTDAYSMAASKEGMGFKPTFSSTALHMQQHQQMLRQQRMMEQSKVLLEQSKAKHQAMIAQAHAAHKSKLEAVEPYAPKPPDGQPPIDRKHRPAR